MDTYEFATIFEYILTDRSSEFGDPVALETGISDIQRSIFALEFKISSQPTYFFAKFSETARPR